MTRNPGEQEKTKKATVKYDDQPFNKIVFEAKCMLTPFHGGKHGV